MADETTIQPTGEATSMSEEVNPQPAAQPATNPNATQPMGEASAMNNEPTAQPQPAAQPNTPQQQPKVDLSKSSAPPQAQKGQQQDDGRTGFAKGFYRFAEALAGGPRFKTTVDVNTGKTTREAVPLGKGQIGLAIALEALSGSFAGLQAGRGRGPGAAGLAGMQAGRNVVEQRNAADERDAAAQQQNLANQSATARANMEMARGRIFLASGDRDNQQKDVDTYAPVYKQAVDGSFVDTEVDSDEELNKKLQDGSLHLTRDMAIPIAVVDKLDANGKQALGPNGEKLFTHRWAILKPNAQITLPKETVDYLVQHKVQGYVNGDGKAIDLPENPQLRIPFVIHAIESANKMRNAEVSVRGLAAGQKNTVNKETAPTKGAPLLDKVTDAITPTEGKPGDINYRNHNQGNLKPTAFVQSLPGYQGIGEGGYAKFDSDENGRSASIALLKNRAQSNPEWTLQDYFKHYLGGDGDGAEVKDNGDILVDGKVQGNYIQKADTVAKSAGVTADTKLGDIVSGQSHDNNNKSNVSDDKLNEAVSQLDDKMADTITNAGGADAWYTGKPGEMSKADMMVQAGKLDPQSAFRVKSMLDSIKPIEQERQARIDAQLQGQVDKAQKIAQDKADIEGKEEQRMQAYLQVPKGWQGADANVLDQTPDTVKAQLEAKGVQVPDNLAGLIAIAKGEADLKTLPQKHYKGTNTMDAANGLTYIRNFLNPGYNESDYESMAKFNNELKSSRNGTAGGSLLNAGTAANHLVLLEQNAAALANHDTQVINKVANMLGIQVGKSPAVTFKAIADQVNQEVGKTVAGGSAHVSELEKLDTNLNAYQSPDQIKGVIGSYINLMQGRITEINQRSMDVLHREVKVSPEVAKVFGSRGLDVPGWGKPYVLNGRVIGLTKDGKTFSLKFDNAPAAQAPANAHESGGMNFANAQRPQPQQQQQPQQQPQFGTFLNPGQAVTNPQMQ